MRIVNLLPVWREVCVQGFRVLAFKCQLLHAQLGEVGKGTAEAWLLCTFIRYYFLDRGYQAFCKYLGLAFGIGRVSSGHGW